MSPQLCRQLAFVGQAKLYPRILAAMKPGATLGLSHGFLLGVMQSDGADFRADIDVVLMAPKVTSPPNK
jgi:ketol-acid reductoisomerase